MLSRQATFQTWLIKIGFSRLRALTPRAVSLTIKMDRQKSSEDRYTIIPRTLIFLRRDQTVLLIKGAKDKRLWADLYNGVGGHIEQGEDIFSAARRELCEETGLTPDNLFLCGTILIDTGDKPGIGIFVFTGECKQGDPKPSIEGSLRWVNPDDLSALRLVEDLPVLLPRVLRWKPGDIPFSGIYKIDPIQGSWNISLLE